MNGPSNGNLGDDEGNFSGSSGMYGVSRPYELPQDVKLPSCMYQVQPINSQAAVSESNHGIVSSSVSRGTLTNGSAAVNSYSSSTMTETVAPEALESLELRQLQIIDKLTKLKEMITTIHEKCVGAGAGTTSADPNSNAERKPFGDNIDIVVNAHPNKPPYSLIFFASLLENSYSNAVVSVSCHVHSSFKGSFTRKLEKIFTRQKPEANVTFTVIWKDVSVSSMVVTPVQSTAIEKEANIARFLSRLLPATSTLNYDCLSWDTLIKVDSFLDQSNDLKVVSFVERELKKSNQGFVAGELTVADLILYSSIVSKLLSGEGLKSIPATVVNWLKRIETSFGVWISGLSG